jgi:hypothetical protein
MTKRFLCVFLLASSMVSAQPKTPSQVYLEYRAAFEQATSLEALRPYLAAPVLGQVDAVPPTERPKLLDAMKVINAAFQVHVTADTATPEGHVLIVDGVDGAGKPIRGTVDLVKEAGRWKIAKESWHGR